MTSQGSRIPLDKALVKARAFMELIQPFTVRRQIAGSIRRQVKMVGDIEIVCVENPFNAIDNLIHPEYPGLEVNGPRYKKIIKDKIQIDLFIAQPLDYGRILAIRTGSAEFSHKRLATRWRDLGWCGTEHGLRKIEDCIKKGNRWAVKKERKGQETLPPMFDTEYDFFNFLNIPWIPPEERNI
jgi:DNA polymerase/3'-5' exonuclease PolX